VKISSSRLIEALNDQSLLRRTRGRIPAELTAITDDTRTVEKGGIFVAIKGATRDGHHFSSEAAKKGAVATIVEDESATSLPALVVTDGRRAAAIAACVAYDWPARALRLIGVTGTNGKTTTVAIVRHILDDAGAPAASVGTLGVFLGENRPLAGGNGLTTPGAIELQRLLRQLVDRGIRTVAMEVSSHSLDQHRVDGVTFDAAVYTNLTRDHLDYHQTMEAYFSAKARLLGLLKPTGTAVINADAAEWRALPSAKTTITYGIKSKADVRAEDVSLGASGSEWNLLHADSSARVTLPLMGTPNVYNALAASAAAIALGKTVGDCAEKLRALPQIAGRLERISENPVVLRDYAHTPDALERTLVSARQLTKGRLIVVFGCGGERDRGKRPAMGEVAERLADVAVVTSDNPRTEDPDAIIDEIEQGMRGKHERVTDRRAAIEKALRTANRDDLIVLAGKGHETYQIRGTDSFPFDEREIVADIKKSLNG